MLTRGPMIVKTSNEHECLWCDRPEHYWHAVHDKALNRRVMKKVRYKPGPSVGSFICSSCVQMLLWCSQEKLKELWQQCEAKGLQRKLEALQSFMGEKEYVPKTREVRSSMVRKGSMRTVRPARYQVRA
jgi:hypothetical protein